MEHQGETLSIAQISTLEVLFRRFGEDRVMQFGIDSATNRIPYNRHEEQLSVQAFAKLLKPAILNFLDSPIEQQLPSWARVVSCESSLQQELAKAGK
tara:strand:- start:914 stop:1204 length:291 start_codon:yes stop_codon:yes gene_type:complete